MLFLLLQEVELKEDETPSDEDEDKATTANNDTENEKRQGEEKEIEEDGDRKKVADEGKEVQKKRVMPEVNIPADLIENQPLKVLRAQVKALLEGMDNTKEEDWLSGKKKTGVGSGLPLYGLSGGT